MALSMLRERQKYIIWITAIILIPSFVVFIGVGSSRRQGIQDPPVLRIDGEKILWSQYRDFVRRMQAMNAIREDLPFGSPAVIRQVGLVLLQVSEARERGLRVSEEEIGRLYALSFPQFAPRENQPFDRQGFEKHLRVYLQMSPLEFRKAAEEWLLLNRFQYFLNSGVVSPLEAYSFWVTFEAAATYDVVEVKTADYRPAAEEAFRGHEDAEIDKYLQANSKNLDLFSPGKWTLEYLLVRPDPEAAKARTDRAVQAYYDAHREEYAAKTLDEARPEIEPVVAEEVRRETARRSLRDEIDPLLIEMAGAEGGVTAEKVVASPTLQNLAKSGRLQIGATSPEALSAQELEQSEVLGRCPELTAFLTAMDRLSDAAKRAATISSIRENFNNRVAPPEGGEPIDFANANGAFKIRVLDYRPGALRDPKTDAGFREEIRARLLEERAESLARAAVKEKALQFSEGANVGSIVTRRTSKFYEVPALANAEVVAGVPDDAQPNESGDGFEVRILRSRAIPSYADYTALPEEEKKRDLEFLVHQGGERLHSWQIDALRTGRVELLLEEQTESD
ncbi:MAG: SurA N-terminal domain-containing protein [Planctomycetota bacterium]